jgi:hypothetical protein
MSSLQSAQHDKFQWDQAIATLKDVKFWLVSAIPQSEVFIAHQVCFESDLPVGVFDLYHIRGRVSAIVREAPCMLKRA